METIANVLSALGLGSASTGSKTCVYFLIDEPKCPKSLIK